MQVTDTSMRTESDVDRIAMDRSVTATYDCQAVLGSQGQDVPELSNPPRGVGRGSFWPT